MRKLMVMLMAAIVSFGCVEPVEESFIHEVEYRISVSFVPDVAESPGIESVNNLTLILPLPMLNGRHVDLKNMSFPDGWRVEVVETEYGKMIELKAGKVNTWRIVNMPVPIEEGSNVTPTPVKVKRPASYDFEVMLKLNRDIDTKDPFDEYLLNPKFNLQEVECPEDYVKHYEYVKCYKYDTAVYYTSEPFVPVEVVVWLKGANYWFQMGWTGNEYDDNFHIQITSEGWSVAEGSLVAGKGRYR